MLREVHDQDLPTFFEHQLSSDAQRMAGLPGLPRDTFMAHWRQRILADSSVVKRTIVSGDEVVGNILSWNENDRRFVGYWIGQQHWGHGIATAALTEFLRSDPARPLWARVTLQNHASIRVLQKSRFHQVGTTEVGADGLEEHVFRLDA